MIVGLAAAGAIAGIAVVRARARRREPAPLAATGIAARNARLAAAGARSGAAYAVHRARRAVTPTDARAALDEAYQLRTVAQVVETLGNMKGALMKIGQMASYLDDGMPAPMQAALASLQQDAPPMAPELRRARRARRAR